MFNNISGKIKLLAFLTFWIGIGASVIFGIVGLVDGITWEDEGSAALGILLLICGPIWAWVTSWLLYGFAQLIENTEDLAKTNSVIAYGDQQDKVEVLYKVGNQYLSEKEYKSKTSGN